MQYAFKALKYSYQGNLCAVLYFTYKSKYMYKSNILCHDGKKETGTLFLWRH